MRADASCRIRVERKCPAPAVAGKNKKCGHPIDKQPGSPVTATQMAPEWDRVARGREVGLDGDHRFVAMSGAARR